MRWNLISVKWNNEITNEIPVHFIHESKTIAYDVIELNVSLCMLMRFLRKNTGVTGAYKTSGQNVMVAQLLILKTHYYRISLTMK